MRRSSLVASAILTAYLAYACLAADTAEPKIDIGGQYRIMANYGNAGWHPASIGNDQDTSGFINQRFRTWLDVKTGENIGGHLQLEVGHIMWGEDDEFTKTYGGDSVGIEMRRGYLTYEAEAVGNFKIGIQAWSDSFGDVLASGDWDFNVGGVSVSRDLVRIEGMTLKLGGFTIRDSDATASDGTVLLSVDLSGPCPVTKADLGVSVYYLNDKGGYSYGTFGGP